MCQQWQCVTNSSRFALRIGTGINVYSARSPEFIIHYTAHTQKGADASMIWLVAIGCLAIGVVVGVVVASRLSSSPSRVRELESQIRSMKENHREYRDSVSDHFSMTAELVQHMTESYREVYQHLASGAQDLCSSEVANKLLPTDSDAVFDTVGNPDQDNELIPPRDYAAKQSPDQKGALSEEFGLEKTRKTTDEEGEPDKSPS